MQITAPKADRTFAVDKTGGRLVQKTRFGAVIGHVSFKSDCWRGIHEFKRTIAAAHDAAAHATVRFG